ncbi:ABC transporter permease subunit [uncultured Arenimonas sp.]|uniref:ABC transporter permease n=1 Tax=uncultured Arenimonas sp. TaxID=546226 RepID=UPI0030DC5237
MDALRRFAAIVHADFRERSRSTRFWVVLCGVGIATWWLFPGSDAGYVTFGVGDARGLYSSAWVGMVLGMLYASMLSLFGFYIVRGTLSRDFETRVWQLLVATPMTRPGYLLAKWTSHMLVFALLVAVGLGIGLVAQQWHGEATTIDLWQLLLPSLVFAVPALAVAAFFAVLFDLLPWLRRTGGNVLYFFLWIFIFISLGQLFDPEKSAWAASTWLSEPSGISLAMRDIQDWLAQTQPERGLAGFSIGVSIREGATETFAWNAWQPEAIDLLGRLLWLALAAGGVLALAPALDWAAARWLDWLLRPFELFPAGRLAAAEVRLVLRQRRITWWLALLVLLGVQAFAPEKGMAIAAILAWLLCVDVFAGAALRERDTGTASLVFSAAGAGRRILLARLGLALGLAWAVVLPALLRSLATDPGPLPLLATGASVAVAGLALGASCRNARPFELAMVFLAYIGVQGDPILNALADPAANLARHAWLLPASALLLLPAWFLALRRR